MDFLALFGTPETVQARLAADQSPTTGTTKGTRRPLAPTFDHLAASTGTTTSQVGCQQAAPSQPPATIKTGATPTVSTVHVPADPTPLAKPPANPITTATWASTKAACTCALSTRTSRCT